MFLVRLSGHSGAGKSRLLAASKASGLNFHRHILYTSRSPLSGETDGKDYYFRSRKTIEQLPQERFIVRPVRQMLQAVDIDTLEHDLRSNKLVIVEIHYKLWPDVKTAIIERLGKQLKTLSVYLTTVDPSFLRDVCAEEAAIRIRESVERILTFRGRDSSEEIHQRADSAVEEVLGALRNKNAYDSIIFSAPEGPNGQDDWTRDISPVGQAAQALKEFLSLIKAETSLPQSETKRRGLRESPK